MGQRRRRPTKGRLAILAFAALMVAALVPLAVGAEVTPNASAADLAAAISSTPGLVTGAEFEALASPGAAGVVTTPISGFPTDGGTSAIISTGNVASLEPGGGTPSTNLGGPNVRGDTDFDVTILRVDFVAPAEANCLLGVDFRFLSEEYPEWVGTKYNDAFIAELDESTWTTDGSEINAPGNIAFDPVGSEISINAAGVTSVTAPNAQGTQFDGATPILRAAAPLAPGPHSLYLSMFDQGDHILDSAVLLDNLRVGTVENPDDCKAGAEPVEPTASFTVDPPTGPAPLDVTVNGSGSTDSDGTIASYEWDFGNGTTGTGPTSGTTYASPGDYTITLTVTDDEGFVGKATQVVTVTEGGQGDGPVVSAGSSSGLERDEITGSVFVPVFLSRASSEPVVVSFHTEDGTATAGQDYVRWGSPDRPRTVTIPAGSLQTTVNVPVMADGDVESDESFSVVISSVSGGGAVIGQAVGTGTIVDPDGVAGDDPAITVSSGSVHEGDDGQRRAQFFIHLSRPPANNVTVTYATVDGSATAGQEYVEKIPGRVTFAPGQVSKTIDVLVNSDTAAGDSTDFFLDVDVVAGSPVTKLHMSGKSTILDDD